MRFPISGGRFPERELSCKKTARRRVHSESEEGMVLLKELERRLSLANMRSLAMWSLSRPPSWRRGKRSPETRLLLSQKTPRQSQGAAGVEESQPFNAPSGSCRLSLNEVKASISARFSGLRWAAHDNKGAPHSSTRKKRISAAMALSGGLMGMA